MPRSAAPRDHWHFARPRLAASYLDALDLGLQSARGLFAKRRMGKTEFLTKDLLPAAQARGYLTAYANLWDDQDSPARVLVSAMTQAVVPKGVLARVSKTLKTPITRVKAGGKIAGIGEGQVEAQLGEDPSLEDGLRDALARLDKTRKKLLLVIDEAQVLAATAHGGIAHSLRAALDVRKDTVKVIFAGSSEGTLRRMFGRSSEPFYNWAPLEPFALLGPDFVRAMIERANRLTRYPLKVQDGLKAYAALNDTPDFFRRFLDRYLTHAPDGVAAALVHTKAVVYEGREFRDQWARLLPADQAVLQRVAAGEADLFGKSARERMGKWLCLEGPVNPSTVNNSLARLQSSAMLTKLGAGEYAFEDEAFAQWIRNLDG